MNCHASFRGVFFGAARCGCPESEKLAYVWLLIRDP